ncbi:hypothetical protein ACJHYQ_18645, partial [Escherichia sp. WS1088]
KSTIQRGKPPEWWEKQKGSRGIRRGQWYRLVFQFPIRELISGIKRNQEKNNKLYEEKLNSLSKAVKPFSTRTAIAICALCTLCLSAAFSGATWYVAQHEKEASLRFYARAFLDMKKITEESMRKLPKSDQQNIKLKLEEIDSRKP